MDINNIIREAAKIKGFMDIPDLRWLAEKASNYNIACEFGSWKGRSSYAIGSAIGQYLVCVDHFKGTSDVNDVTSMEIQAYGLDGVYNEFTQNVASLIQQNKIIVIRDSIQNSNKILRETYSNKFDMCFIDANHTYDAVKFDIDLAKAITKKGGLVCGHDIVSPFDVPRVVKEVYGNNYKVNGCNIWYAINE